MKIKVTDTFRDFDGNPVKETQGSIQTDTDLTLRTVCKIALMNADDTLKIDGKKKVERYHLAFKIHNEDMPDLKSEEITMLKDLIGKTYSPLIVAQSWEKLDPPN